jgi:hypothetical protein
MLVVLLRCQLVPEIMHVGAPEVFKHQKKLKSHHMTSTVLGKCKTKTKQKQKRMNKFDL